MEFDVGKVAEMLQDTMKDMPKEKVGVVVVGSTGAGKSTLLNAMFGTHLARTGIGGPQTQEAEWWPKADDPVSERSPLRILDTKGIEEEDYEGTVNAMLKAVDDANSSEDAGDHAHMAWLVIKESSARIQQSHVKVAGELAAKNVPVIVALTESIGQDGALEEAVRNELPDVRDVVSVNSISKKLRNGAEIPPDGLEDLAEACRKVLPEARQNAFDRASIVTIGRKKKLAEGHVKKAAIAAAAAGASPIPFSDAAILVPIQIGMIAKVSHAYGMEFDRSAIMPIVSAVGGSVAATFAGRAIFTGILKFVPVAGTLVGGAISATTAAALTTALGTVYVQFLHGLCKMNKGEPPTIEQVTDGFADFWKANGEEARRELDRAGEE